MESKRVRHCMNAFISDHNDGKPVKEFIFDNLTGTIVIEDNVEIVSDNDTAIIVCAKLADGPIHATMTFRNLKSMKECCDGGKSSSRGDIDFKNEYDLVVKFRNVEFDKWIDALDQIYSTERKYITYISPI